MGRGAARSSNLRLLVCTELNPGLASLPATPNGPTSPQRPRAARAQGSRSRVRQQPVPRLTDFAAKLYEPRSSHHFTDVIAPEVVQKRKAMRGPGAASRWGKCGCGVLVHVSICQGFFWPPICDPQPCLGLRLRRPRRPLFPLAAPALKFRHLNRSNQPRKLRTPVPKRHVLVTGAHGWRGHRQGPS